MAPWDKAHLVMVYNLFNVLLELFQKIAASFNFMAAVTICSDFGAQKNKV